MIVERLCSFVFRDGRHTCKNCGYVFRHGVLHGPIYRTCEGKICTHLDEPIENDGVAIMVKCGCSNIDRQVMIPAYQCNAPQRQRKNNKPARCLPTHSGQWDADHQLEASIYQACTTCEYKEATNGI